MSESIQIISKSNLFIAKCIYTLAINTSKTSKDQVSLCYFEKLILGTKILNQLIINIICLPNLTFYC